MPKAFSTTSGYVQKSLTRPRRWYWKDYSSDASGYISNLRAWFYWRTLGKPVN
jgi:hypothetical protein